MGTAYGINNCIGWYRAGTNAYSDAGITAAVAGDGIYQWNDLSGNGNHLLQTTSANRPVYNAYTASLTSTGAETMAPFGQAICKYQPSSHASLLFDGSASYFNIPATLSLAGSGCTVLMCTRGPYYSPISFGTNGIATIGYGWTNGTPQQMAIYNGGRQTFPAVTYLPILKPIVHGFRCSASLNESRLYMGTNQTAAVSQNLCNFSLTGGAIGRMLNVNDGAYGNYSFGGEIYEMTVFSLPLSDSYVAGILDQMQTANGLTADTSTNQVVFIGDSLTAGGPGIVGMSNNYPAVLMDQISSIRPLIIAAAGQTIAQQQSTVTDQVIPLDLKPFNVTVAIVCCGSEDIAAGRSDTQVVSDLATLCTGLRSSGIKVMVATITPRNSSSGYTTANVATLNAVNVSIRSGYTLFADALVDWAADSRLSDCTNTTYFSDQWHTTHAGDCVKAAIVKTALDAILVPPQSVLSYASFYTPGRTYAGRFGNFARS